MDERAVIAVLESAGTDTHVHAGRIMARIYVRKQIRTIDNCPAMAWVDEWVAVPDDAMANVSALRQWIGAE